MGFWDVCLGYSFWGERGFCLYGVFVGQRDWRCYKFQWFEVAVSCLGFFGETRIGGRLFVSKFSMKDNLDWGIKMLLVHIFRQC